MISRIALAFKFEARQQARAAFVAQHVVRHDTVQMQHVERPRDACFKRLVHHTVTLPMRSDAVAEMTSLKRPAHEIRAAERGDDLRVSGSEYQQRVTTPRGAASFASAIAR